MQIITSKSKQKHSLKQIIKDHFDNFVLSYYKKRNIRDTVFNNVSKLLNCRSNAMGFATFKCDCCGEKICQPFTCKSRFCTSCAIGAMNNWYNNFLSWRPQHLKTYHTFLTIPQELRRFFCVNRECEVAALRILQQTACTLLYDYFLERFNCRIGGVWVLHTFGADSKRNPHIHFLMTAGGIDKDDPFRRIPIYERFFPYQELKAKRKYHVLTACREFGKQYFSESVYREFNKLIDFLFSQKDKNGKPKSWFIRKGEKIVKFRCVIKYLVRYLKRPCIAESRITQYDGNDVVFQFKDRDTKQIQSMTMSGPEFVGHIVRHIPDKHFKMVGYFGIFANRCKKKNLEYLSISHPSPTNNSEYKPLPSSFREKLMAFTGKDPRQCSCGGYFYLYSITFISKNGLQTKYIDDS